MKKLFFCILAVMVALCTACDKTNEPNGGNSETPVNTVNAGKKLVKRIYGLATYSNSEKQDTLEWNYQYYDDGTLKQVACKYSGKIRCCRNEPSSIMKDKKTLILVEDGITCILDASGFIQTGVWEMEEMGRHYVDSISFSYIDQNYLFAYKRKCYAEGKLYKTENEFRMWNDGNLTWIDNSQCVYNEKVNNTNLAMECEYGGIMGYGFGPINCGYLGKHSKNFLSRWDMNPIYDARQCNSTYDYTFDAVGNPTKVTEVSILETIDVVTTVFEIEYY